MIGSSAARAGVPVRPQKTMSSVMIRVGTVVFVHWLMGAVKEKKKPTVISSQLLHPSFVRRGEGRSESCQIASAYA